MCHPIGHTAFTQFQNLLHGFILNGSLRSSLVLTVKDIVDLIHGKLAETCDRIFSPRALAGGAGSAPDQADHADGRTARRDTCDGAAGNQGHLLVYDLTHALMA